jgi:DegV family protein with EDD domain
VTLSSELSATHQAATLAAKSIEGEVPIRVVDSKAVTMAQGLMAVAAAKLGEDGSSVDDCAAAVEELVARTRIFATLDTLENLKKGGRIGKAQALFGSLLSIKPVIELRDGVVEAESKQRTRSKSLRYLVEKVKEAGKVENLVVMHGEAPDLEEFVDLISGVYSRDDLIVGDIGAVIGTHAGPRVMGVVFHVPR